MRIGNVNRARFMRAFGKFFLTGNWSRFLDKNAFLFR